MTLRPTGYLAVACVLCLVLVAPITGVAQNDPQKNPGEGPWTGPRTADGQPDIRGSYQLNGTRGTWALENPQLGGGRFTGYLTKGKETPKNPSRLVDPPDGIIPYLPAAKALRDRMEARAEDPTDRYHIDTQVRCLHGPVRSFHSTDPRFFQVPGYVVILYDQYHYYRVISLKEQHPGSNIKMWAGDSVGRWEGNTLVIDVGNVNGKARLSVIGDFYGPGTKITERLTFLNDRKTIQIRATFADPTLYSRPWTVGVLLERDTELEKTEFWEYGCHEGDRSPIFIDKSLKP